MFTYLCIEYPEKQGIYYPRNERVLALVLPPSFLRSWQYELASVACINQSISLNVDHYNQVFFLRLPFLRSVFAL